MFADKMNRGPFARWLHRHTVSERGRQECTLTDDIEYELPFGAVAPLPGWGLL